MRTTKTTVLFAAFFSLLFACSACSRAGYGPPGDQCPDNDQKTLPGVCGCDVPDDDTDGDGTPDCVDQCASDSDKANPGVCGCGVSDVDTDSDNTPDCNDPDDDGDGFLDSVETACGSDPLLSGSTPADADADGMCDTLDICTGNNASGDTDSDRICNDQDTDDDGDSWSDVDEIACGTDPLLSSSVPADVNHDHICDANQIVELKYTASDAQATDWYGSSVAIGGDVAIVGAYGEDGGAGEPALNAGAAYMIQVDSGQWVEKQILTASDAEAEDSFGYSVAISGDVVIVGAPFNDVGSVGDPNFCGAAYMIHFESDRWVEKQRLIASDAQANDWFGYSVAIGGDVAIVGAKYEDGGASDPVIEAGAAYIFQLDSGQWVEKQKLTASDAQGSDWLGNSVAISGTVAIVGAVGEDGGTGDPLSNAGAAYIFQLDAGQWVEKQKLTVSDAQAEDAFGYSVAINGDLAIVGASGKDGGAGAAYVYQLELGQWVQKQKLTASDAQAGDAFGYSVAINGDLAIVGADLEDGGAGDPTPDAGAAYMFRLESGTWVEKRKLTSSSAQAYALYGSSVAINDNVAIVGARAENGGAGDPSRAGAAYLYLLGSL